MPKQNVSLLAFNRGIVSPLALARTDIDRLSLSAEAQSNWMPRTLGSMMLRPGTEYIDSTLNDQEAELIPFIFSTTDTALIELTNNKFRVLVDGEPLQRASVSTAVSNGNFSSGTTNWTDLDEAGAVSDASSGYLSLIGTGFNAAARSQEVTVAGADQNVRHALKITVLSGTVRLMVGTTSGDGSYISTFLGVGYHSIAFTPAGNFFIHLSNSTSIAAWVDDIAIEQSGDLTVTTTISESDIPLCRWDQSADVVFIACQGKRQMKIERRAQDSWSFVIYDPLDGPFFTYNQTNIKLEPDGISGDIQVLSSSSFFRSGHVNSIFRIDSIGQKIEESFNGDDQFSDEIRITGIDASRAFSITISGTWSATITLQRSIAEPGAWVDVLTYTGNVTTSYDDGLDNQIIYYRLGIKSSDYVSGTADIALEFSGGSRTGIFRITAVTSDTSALAYVIVPLGGIDATTAWAEGMWSDYRGYPSAVALYEGRLWWAGKDRIWGSVSDEYESFDDEVAGDAGPIIRAIGAGPVDVINWLLPLQRLIVGTDGSEKSARSTSFDEPLTPTNINLKDASTQGSAFVAPAKIDSRGVFVQRSGIRVYLLGYDIATNDYQTTDLSVLTPEIGKPNIVKVVVQRQPDTRIHCIREDGKVAIHVFDPIENVSCWVLYETDGEVETAAVLPGQDEDEVYYVVKRSVDGNDVRYIEKWAIESESIGGAVTKLADSHLTYSGASTATITGLSHLEGKTVVAWGNSKDLGEYTVSGGQVTLSEAVTSAVIGLKYEARYKSSKLAYAAGLGTALVQRKKLNQLGLILANCHASGVKYGPDFDHLDDLPAVENGAGIDADYIHESYDEDMFEFNGEWDTDSRLCLRAEAPKPCTVLAAIMSIQTNDKG